MASNNLFQSLRRLTCFAAIADAGSVKGGATRLGLSVPVVSTALAELEEELGVKLAVRSTRKLALTRTGQQVHEHAQRMLEAADRALNESELGSDVEGELRMTLPVELASRWLPGMLREFHDRYPRIALTIDTDDSVVPLHSSEYDIAIQASYQAPASTADTGLRRSRIPLGRIELTCVASRRLKLSWSGNSVMMNTALIEQKQRGDELIAVDKKTGQIVRVFGRSLIRTNNHESALALVKSGLGAVMLMQISVAEDLADKRLVRVLPQHDFGHLRLEAKLRDSMPSPATRAFVEFLKERCSADSRWRQALL